MSDAYVASITISRCFCSQQYRLLYNPCRASDLSYFEGEGKRRGDWFSDCSYYGARSIVVPGNWNGKFLLRRISVCVCVCGCFDVFVIESCSSDYILWVSSILGMSRGWGSWCGSPLHTIPREFPSGLEKKRIGTCIRTLFLISAVVPIRSFERRKAISARCSSAHCSDWFVFIVPSWFHYMIGRIHLLWLGIY